MFYVSRIKCYKENSDENCEPKFFSNYSQDTMKWKNYQTHREQIFLTYRVSQKTWEFSDEFDIVFLNNSLI